MHPVRHALRRSRTRAPIGILAGIAALCFGSALESAPAPGHRPGAICAVQEFPSLADAVRNRLEAARAGGRLAAAGEMIRARKALPEFYLERGWLAAWTDSSGISSCGRRLIAAIPQAQADGLVPDDYHLGVLRDLAAGSGPETEVMARVDLELLLTDAWLTLGSHLLQGRVNPVTLEGEWLANRRQAQMGPLLEKALGDDDVMAALDALRPVQPEYRRLRVELVELREVAEAGGWGRVPPGATLHPGDEDLRVEALRRRLFAAGDLLEREGLAGTVFDSTLARAVVAFQLRHGLEADGNVGPRTYEALNIPVESRMSQVAVNLERWRWLPDDLGARHIRVDIAGYRVEVRDRGAVALEMRAVVGRQYRQTPMFSSRMTHLVLAPYWHVPPGIAANDKLPELRRNPGYLAAQKMTLLDQATGHPVDPAEVDFAALTGAEFNRRYRIRQDPGPLNALGRVKFIFPNPHNVYLHDTPSRELFARTERAFSSGCIRLERPLELADYLLRGEPEWTPERIRAAAERTTETTVRFPAPIPVHILYWTAFVDGDDRVHFRPDLYQRDARVRDALDADPPGL